MGTLSLRQYWRALNEHGLYALGTLAYFVFDAMALAFCRVRPQIHRVALLQPDLLGDVLMWLPYGQALATHLQRQCKEVVLICDKASSTLMQNALPGCEMISIAHADASLIRPLRRIRWLRRLRALGVAQTYFMTHPRGPMNWGESMVKALGAPAVGFVATFHVRPRWEVAWSNRYYSRLLPTTCGVQTHVGVHYAQFLNALGLDAQQVVPAALPVTHSLRVAADYWVLAPGASAAYRRWPAENFVAIGRNLAQQHPQWRCLIVGTKSEKVLCDQIAAQIGESALNLAGKTSLLELIELIAQARLLLGNDSGAGHIAAAVGTPSVIVTGGGHWGRCFPYPPDAPIRKHPVAVGFPMPCYGCDWQCVHTSRKDKPYPCIEGITIEAVMQAVEGVLADSAQT